MQALCSLIRINALPATPFMQKGFPSLHIVAVQYIFIIYFSCFNCCCFQQLGEFANLCCRELVSGRSTPYIIIK